MTHNCGVATVLLLFAVLILPSNMSAAGTPTTEHFVYQSGIEEAYSGQTGEEFIIPAYWGETYVDSIKRKADQMIDSLQGIFKVLAVILLLFTSGILTHLLTASLPTIPMRFIFYSTLGLVSMVWFWITGMYSTVIWAAIVLVIPHLVMLVWGNAAKSGMKLLKRRGLL